MERVVGTLRRELLDHIIPINERHLHRLLTEYLDRYDHPVTTHSSLDHEPPDFDPKSIPHERGLESEPLFGRLYHNYRRNAA